MPIGYSRVNMPSEFYDITSSMLLTQPEPQYLYAQLALASLGASLDVGGSLGLPGREIGGNGAAYSSAERDRLMLANDLISREVFAVKVDFNGQPGDTVRFNRPKFTDSTYTAASRRLSPGQTISTTPVTIEGEQALIQLQRYAGPYDGTNTRVAPYAIEAYDASRGVHNAATIVGTHLKRDFHKTIDKFLVDLCDDGATAVRPGGMSADNDATAAGQFPLDYETLSRVAKTMDEANLPVFPNGKRILTVTPTGVKQLKDDPQFARYAQYFQEKNPLFTEMFAETPEFMLFKSNTLSQVANTSSVNIHVGHAIAPGALGLGMGRPPAVRNSTDDNYGETVRVIWLGDLAFSLLDSRFVYQVRYTQD
jgi:N4-gp56 family major capsid protein